MGGYSHSYRVTAPYKIDLYDICDSFPEEELNMIAPYLGEFIIVLTVKKEPADYSTGYPEGISIVGWTRPELPAILNLFSDSIDDAIDEYIYDNEDSICESEEVKDAVNYLEDSMALLREATYRGSNYLR